MSDGGLSEARLGRMHEVMAGYVERGELPGLVSLVCRRGEVHVDAIGKLSIGGRDPMRRDTIFRIASMTKPVAAVAAMILAEECKLRLDEPVDRLLPELAGRKVLKRVDGPLDDTVPAKRPITVRDLLTFRMGFGILLVPPGTYPIQKAIDEQVLGQGPPKPQLLPGPDEWIRRLGTLPLMDQPGERWMYHSGSDVLGVLIARASGRPLEMFLRERIFEPLGMKDTGFSVPEAKIGRLATSYEVNPKTGALDVYDEAKGGQWSRPPQFPSAGGGARLNCRRLPGVQPDDAQPRQARQRAHSLPAFDRDHDDRSVDSRAEIGDRPGPWLLEQSRVGLRCLGSHPSHRRVWARGPVWLGRRPGHLLAR
jgi:CubicO group peptidase (beta-lactamase class C family)